jgi:WD40 repeat protein
VRFSPDGTKLAVAGSRQDDLTPRTAKVFDLTRGVLDAELPHGDEVVSLAWYPDSRTLATAVVSGQILAWSLDDVKHPTATPIASRGEAYPNIAMNRTGEVLTSAAQWGNNGYRVYHPRTGRLLFQMPGNYGSRTSVFSPDGHLTDYTDSGDQLLIHEFVPGREYRTLVRRPMADGVSFITVDVHPGGRLMAAGHHGGVVFFDLETGDEVGFVAIGGSDVWFEPVSGALWTSSTQAGVCRWPVEVRAEGPRIGPPDRRFEIGHWDRRVRGSRDGRVVAVGRWNGTVVVRADRSASPVLLEKSEIRHLSVSPDGRWIAAHSHEVWSTQVWDARSGTVVREFTGHPFFSPDGRWFYGGDPKQGNRLWEVGTWEPGPAVPRGREHRWRRFPRTARCWPPRAGKVPSS